MGLCGLFMVLGGEGVMEDLPLGNMPEMQWGSTDSRYNILHIRLPICVNFFHFRGALFRMVLMSLFSFLFFFSIFSQGDLRAAETDDDEHSCLNDVLRQHSEWRMRSTGQGGTGPGS
jgi:hypothetical protein